ncbi:MAG: hypothetical protein H6700_10305 [Myxococcales bacterium]|nr:hypothetical protein [Myxococcales bacterium]
MPRTPIALMFTLVLASRAQAAEQAEAPDAPDAQLVPDGAVPEGGAEPAPGLTQSPNTVAAPTPADVSAASPATPDRWRAELPRWLGLNAEYRARTVYINPLELNDTGVRSIDWTEHRLRVGLDLSPGPWLTLHTRMDLLDGVVWGDNGSFTGEPATNSGVAIAARRPNATSLDVGLVPGQDPLDPDSYRPVLQSADALQVDHAYADAVLPFGILRVGRQPAAYGASLGGHDGTRTNRWGASSYGDIADRFLFGTKLDEAVRMIRGIPGDVDPSLDNGVLLVTWLDLYNSGAIYRAGDSLRQNGLMLSFARRQAQLRDVAIRGFSATAAAVHLGNDSFATDVWAIPLMLRGSFGDVDVDLNASFLRGQTRELSEGLAVLSPNPPATQDIRAKGARAVVDWNRGPATLTFEVDYAQGDADPRQDTPITSFSYPRDLNVGLLLFERILAYESAKLAGVGIENLRSLDAPSFPLAEASTEGRFTNAVALFPQVLVRWMDTPVHRFHTRFGVLMAWPAAGGAVDPVMTALGEDGLRIDDDAVNYHGGDPGSYYGTEYDLQLQWTYQGAFCWTVEAAALDPGSSLEDENGDAVPSFLLENRFEFLF